MVYKIYVVLSTVKDKNDTRFGDMEWEVIFIQEIWEPLFVGEVAFELGPRKLVRT
jgi:hypothetical protein